jgi:hypothetical protein
MIESSISASTKWLVKILKTALWGVNPPKKEPLRVSLIAVVSRATRVGPKSLRTTRMSLSYQPLAI